MKKLDNAPKTIQITVTLPVRLLEKVDELLNSDGAYISRGDVIRSAILEFHRKQLPDYIYNRSAKDRTKRQQVEFEKNFESMSDLDFAMTYQPLILPNSKGEPQAIFLALGSGLTVLPVTGMKKWKDQDAFISISEGHLDDIKAGKGPDLLRRLHTGGWVKNFKDEYDIDLKPYLDANPIPDESNNS